MNNPFISIVIPFYNAQEYIARCLNSCIEQTFKNIEIILVNDASIDKSLDIINDYKDNRIRILHNETNCGTLYSRFVGAKECIGKYVIFIDSDDYVKSDLCELMYGILSKNEFDIFCFGIKHFPTTLLKAPPTYISKEIYGDAILKYTFGLRTPPFFITGKIYKVTFVNEILESFSEFFSQKIYMAEDLLTSFIFLSCAKSIYGIKKNLYLYCKSDISITRDISFERRDIKIHSVHLVIDNLKKLENTIAAKNIYFKFAQNRAINILRSVIEIEHRHDGQNEWFLKKNFIYIASVIRALKHHSKWQNYLRIAICIFSFGMIRI